MYNMFTTTKQLKNCLLLLYVYTYCLELLSYFAQKSGDEHVKALTWFQPSGLNWCWNRFSGGIVSFFVFVGASSEKSKSDIKAITIAVT